MRPAQLLLLIFWLECVRIPALKAKRWIVNQRAAYAFWRLSRMWRRLEELSTAMEISERKRAETELEIAHLQKPSDA